MLQIAGSNPSYGMDVYVLNPIIAIALHLITNLLLCGLGPFADKRKLVSFENHSQH
jgi:hypothetical protein